jgi:hypothetical protein
MCAVGALMPADILDKIAARGSHNEQSIGALIFTPPVPSPALSRVRVIQVIANETGLYREQIKMLQQTHDDVPNSLFHQSSSWSAAERRANANERVRKWAEIQLQHTGITEFGD